MLQNKFSGMGVALITPFKKIKKLILKLWNG